MPLPQNQLAYPVQNYPVLQVYTGSSKFSWGSELRHLVSSKFLNILLWPVFKFHQRWFTHSNFLSSCKKLPGFNQLWNTIQKGAFAYNSLFLGLSPFRRQATDLADITTLTLFFGDEFIDGLAETAGKSVVHQLVKNDPELFYLRKKKEAGKPSLHYQFDVKLLLSQEILSRVNSKYKINYREFYELLQNFLELINQCLAELPFEKAERAADKIADACNTCFSSFLHDVHGCCEQSNVPDVASVLQFHETKTAYMQEKLLELRCILAGKEEMMQSVQTPGWLNIMRVIQVYDDIQDIIIDEGLQDNIVLSVACHYFPEEWKWFCTNKNVLMLEKNRLVLLSLYMPCSMEYCMQLASEKIRTMNWEQQKIMHYLLFKNKYVLYKKQADECLEEDFFLTFYQQAKKRIPHLSKEEIKSFVVDTLMHVKETRRKIIKKVDFSKAYQLRYDLFLLSETEKATVFDQLIRK